MTYLTLKLGFSTHIFSAFRNFNRIITLPWRRITGLSLFDGCPRHHSHCLQNLFNNLTLLLYNQQIILKQIQDH